MIYLLDTSVVSLPTRPKVSETSLGRLARMESVAAISSPTVSELRFGILRLPAGKNRERLNRYLDDLLSSGIPILPFDLAAAEWHAAERARLATLGQTPPFADGQIAAVAATRGLTLVTLNLRDFERFVGVMVEAW